MQTQDELKEQLVDQIYFIRKSISDFDQNEVEAKRIATHLRTLLHDTRTSTSLLSHFNKVNISFLETRGPIGGVFAYNSGVNVELFFDAQMISNLIWPYLGLVAKKIELKDDKLIIQFLPLYKVENKLGNAEHYPGRGFPFGFANNIAVQRGLTDFDTWWNSVIFDDSNGLRLSRKDLILTLANKDGGAHVDVNLTEKYSKFKTNDLLIINVNTKNEKFQNIPIVLTPIKQEYYSKFRLLFMRLIFSLKLDAYPGSISLLG
jgi:hypothetical protein